ncbi:T9SS type A sorting domain-containing protein [Niastella sp. MAH-29]|uniref:T9SS type A sorting domain-containing protein n=1 Tax=Niastella soli TaxID=2821487 RepID=A0ABS3YLQ8_9BACT|nr:T9SS type A sorting domain-containing protein [Niastella soli]
MIKCAPRQTFALEGTISTVQSGNWSDPGTWGGKLPGASDTPLISSGHIINYDLATANFSGVNISSGGTLQFDSGKSTTLQTTGNVVVEGKLTMRPSSANVIQTLRFINIDESKFVGGGMNVLGTDVGLWAMASGVLDLIGTTKTAFVRAAGSIAANATVINLNSTPVGWQVEDAISIAPTESPTVGDAYLNGFDERTIKSISGSSVTLTAGTLRQHPQINGQWTAEVINLTRNVRVEGTATGRTHIFIRSSVPQTISNIQIRYIGPRKNRGGDATAEFVPGRYGLHFHHCDNGSVGSMVTGCVVRDTGSHCYVPHASNGVTMKGNIAYNGMEIAFWWDVLDATHGIVWDGNLVAISKFIHEALDVDSEDAPTFASSGFLLGVGDDNVCNNNVTIGTTGDFRAGGAYYWMEGLIESVWEFKNNIAHNCHAGLVSWQNNLKNHIVRDSILYNCGMGIYHGAYTNTYLYTGGFVYNSPITIKASSGNSNALKFQNMTIDAAGLDYAIILDEGPLDGERPVFIRNCTITNSKKAGINNASPKALKALDVIQCTTSGIQGGSLSLLSTAVDYLLSSDASSLEYIRVQPTSGTPFQLSKSGKTTIAPFAAYIWGDGGGLKGEYFSDANLSKLVFSRIDHNVSFLDWTQLGVHYKITSNTFSVRWSGKIMAQYSEPYTFTAETGGGVRLWIDGKLIIDSWKEMYPGEINSSSITLVAGQKYDIKLEHFNTDDRMGMGLYWKSNSMQKREYVPMDQLFADPVTTPGNQPPIANAGSDSTISQALNIATLDGAASRDTDGTIKTYAWAKVGGPSQYTITNPGAATTTVTGMQVGVYVFRLTVTDDKGASSSDDVNVTVQAPNVAPVANAGADINLTLPTNYTTLNGGASKDPDGFIQSYKWSLVSGPSNPTIGDASSAATALSGLVAGTYVFQLKVTDDKGATATDNVNVIVSNSGTPANKPPTASAGPDQVITLPTNFVTLNGSASKDPDGSITKYLWTQTSGPTGSLALISNSGSNITDAKSLVAGTYVFSLTVTDNSGATAKDDVTILVNDIVVSPGNQAPEANAGADVTVQLPSSGITLNGTLSKDTDGKIVAYKWVKISGPTTFSLLTPSAITTVLNNMVAGTYVFRLTVTDDKGATDTDTVTVTVLPAKQPDLGILTVTASPNPSTTTFKLKITSANTDSIFIHIYDATGGYVTSIYNVGNNSTVTVGAYWRPGVYTAIVWQGSVKAIIKLVKQ